MDETPAASKQPLPRFLWAVLLLFGAASSLLIAFFPQCLPALAVTASVPVLLWGLQFRLLQTAPLLLLLVPLSVPVKAGSGFVLSFPSEMLVAVTAVYFLCLAFYRPLLPWKLLRHPLTMLLLLEVAWMAVCSALSERPDVGWKRTVVRLTYLIVYLLLASLWASQRPQRSWRLTVLYAIGLTIPVIHAMIFHAGFYFSTTSAYMMAQPFYVDHTLYGACIAFVLPMLLIAVMRPNVFGLGTYAAFALAGLLLLLVTAEVLSFSRAAWVSFGTAVIFWLLIRLRIRLWMIIAVLLALSVTAAYSYDAIYDAARRNDAVSNKGTITEHLQSVGNVQTDASNLERINRWSCAWRMALEKPATGFGPGTYQFEYGRYQLRREMTRISTFGGNRGHAHSELFNALSETGFPGGMIYLVILFTAIGYGLKVIYRERDRKMRLIVTGMLLGLITFYVHGFFNAFLDTDKMASLVFGAIAVIIAADRRQNEKNIPPHATA